MSSSAGTDTSLDKNCTRGSEQELLSEALVTHKLGVAAANGSRDPHLSRVLGLQNLVAGLRAELPGWTPRRDRPV